MQDDIRNAVLKVALGFSVEEVTEEDGELKLVKRKETRKDVPPDLRAVRLLMEGTEVSELSDEELMAEKERLLRELAKTGADREDI